MASPPLRWKRSSSPPEKSGFAGGESGFRKISINVGRVNRVAPNHIVGAITERTSLHGRDIGKIEIYDNNTVVSIPEQDIDTTLAQMKNLKICGTPTVTTLYKGKESAPAYGGQKDYRSLKKKRYHEKGSRRKPMEY